MACHDRYAYHRVSPLQYCSFMSSMSYSSVLLESWVVTINFLLFTTSRQINAAAEVIYANVDPNANIIFGALVDDNMGDDMAVTVIATGFGGGRK